MATDRTTCPRCDSGDIVRTIGRVRPGYAAALLCESCDRQACVIEADPGDAIDAAEKLFFGNGGQDG